jgi:uncharacterized coiled-coil protein SlyX
MTEINFDDLLRLNGRAFVSMAYLAILKRSADDGGMRTYLRDLSQGQTKAEVLLALAQSGEAAALGGPAVDVTPLLAAQQREQESRLAQAENALHRIEFAIADLHFVMEQQHRALSEQIARLHDISARPVVTPPKPLEPVEILLRDARRALGGVPDAARMIENLSQVVRSSAPARSFHNGR